MFEIKGLDELSQALKRSPEMLIKELQTAVDKCGDTILKRVQAKAPGRLKNGMEKKKPKNASGKILGQIQFKKGYGYGVPVELGHGLVYFGHPTNTHIKERPFLRESADESADEIESIITAAVDKVLKEFG